MTGIYVTHDQKEALSIADRLAVLDKGVIQQCGSPQDVYLRPNSKFTANFIGETNFIEGRIARITPEHLEIDSAIGLVISTAFPDGKLEVGQPVTMSLRPEVIHVGTLPKDVTNVFDGHVHDSIYLGEMAQHQVNLNSGPVLKAFELNPKIVSRDDQVVDAKVWFRPNHVVVLTR